MCSTTFLEKNGENDSKQLTPKEPQMPSSDNGEEILGGTSSRNEYDDAGEEIRSNPDNYMIGASLWSRMTFSWTFPLLKLGMERPLVEQDVPNIVEVDSSRYNRDYFLRVWNEEVDRCRKLRKQKEDQHQNQHNKSDAEDDDDGGNDDETDDDDYPKPSLHRAMVRDFFRSIWYVQPCMCAAAVAKIVQAIYLGSLIESFEDTAANPNDGYTYAGIIVACGIVILMEHHHVFFINWRKGMQLRVSCVAAIYDKSLRLSSTHQETSASSGTIMNLASNDVERFLLAALFISHLIWSPLQAIAILIVGWFQMGPAFGVGFGLLIFGFVPLQFYLSNKFAVLRSKIASITDQRVQFVAQAVSGARVMKMSGYEDRFLDRITERRAREIAQIKRANNLKALNEAMFFACNIVVSLAIFLVHVFALGGVLTPGNVYTVFTLVNILQLELTKHVSLGVMGVSEVYVSITRIQKFLEYPEKPNALVASGAPTKTSSNNTKISPLAMTLQNVDCYWNFVRNDQQQQQQQQDQTNTNSTTKSDVSSSDDVVGEAENNNSSHAVALIPALSNVSLDLCAGELTCVIGTVGSGKSALLQAIVGELPVYRGTISRFETIDSTSKDKRDLAYASQDPWIMDGTVRENITMGIDFDQEWYDRVVDACGLRMDFTIFRDGDLTIVGDRGVQCSGGQRARIGLARAIYRDAEILVADDPLSAVDAKVGKQIFYQALLGLCVQRGKCVVLATHQHQYVHDYRCVLLVGGRIECIGEYSECVEAAGGKLSLQDATSDGGASSIGNENETNEPESSSSKQTQATENELQASEGTNDKEKELTKGAEKQNETKEESDAGEVKWETYKNYIRAMGGWQTGSLILATFCVTQGVALWTIISMGQWGELPAQEQQSSSIFGLIVGQVVLAIVLATCRAFLSFAMTIKASRNLHDEMTKAVLRAKIAFFDTNPMGRILNRFSADVGSNDDMLPQTLFDFSVIFFVVIGSVFTTLITLPFVLLVMPPMIYYFVVVRNIFVTSSRELKRLEGVARSPIYAMMNESLSGISTIRANDAKKYFQKKFEGVHDNHTRAFFSFIASSRWVGFRCDSLAYGLMSCVCFLSVLFQTQGWFNIDPAILGLSISMLLQLCASFQWCIRQSAEIVNLMVGVERVLCYGKLTPEAPLVLEADKDLDKSWPQNGAITVRDVDVRYRPTLPLVLDKASFSVPSGARVGVVGRTGSGKSTIIQTLFRLLETESGSINIDNVDISTLGLHRLRTSISVIPQHPTLFSGCTIRENLDVFGLHSEEAIYKALASAHLSDVIAELPKGIDSLVSEGGSNFSVGQRQLLCLARAILSKNKILILDEATASVDRRTDQMLHESLHESFGDATIIAVAHRLDTIIDHDYVLVLGKGKVLEFGPPCNLLRNEGGPFFTMVEDTGETTAKELRQRAFQKEQNGS